MEKGAHAEETRETRAVDGGDQSGDAIRCHRDQRGSGGEGNEEGVVVKHAAKPWFRRGKWWRSRQWWARRHRSSRAGASPESSTAVNEKFVDRRDRVGGRWPIASRWACVCGAELGGYTAPFPACPM